MFGRKRREREREELAHLRLQCAAFSDLVYQSRKGIRSITGLPVVGVARYVNDFDLDIGDRHSAILRGEIDPVTQRVIVAPGDKKAEA